LSSPGKNRLEKNMQKLQEEKYAIGKYSAYLVRFTYLLACSG
jgi:hypothetical protein